MAANKRLNELPTAAALALTDLTIIGQGTNAFKVALSALKTLFSKITATGSPTERSLAERFAEVVNVKDYGAIGDGVADDKVAFQAAFDAGSPVHMPSGTYKISGVLNLPADLTLIGAGRFETTINFTDAGTATIFLRTGVSNGDYHFEGFRLNGNGASKSGGDGIDISRCQSLVVRDVWFSKIWGNHVIVQDDGASPPTDYGAEEVSITDSLFDTNYDTSSAPHMILIDSGKHVKIINNTILEALEGSCIQCFTSLDTVISGNICRGQGSGHVFGGIRVTATAGTPESDNTMRTVISGNYVEGCAYGIFVGENVDWVSVTGNTLVSLEISGILGQSNDGVYSGNVVRNPGLRATGTNYGIIMQQGAAGTGLRNLVSGNRVTDDQGTPTMTYAFHDSSGADFTRWENNYADGWITAEFQTLGSSSRKIIFDVGTSLTPVVTFATNGDFVPTYNTQFGQYTRVADLVYFDILLDFDTNAYTTASGNIRIGGLPFTSRSGNNGTWAVTVSRHSLVDLASGLTQVGGEVAGGQTFLQLFQSGDAVASSALAIANFAASTSNFVLRMSGFYATTV